MKKIFDEEIDDDLLPEYDFSEMDVVARGPGRTGHPIIVEMTGIFGAGYLPDLFRPLTLSLRQNYKRVVGSKTSDIMTVYHVDNSAAAKENPERRERITHLISRSPNLAENEWLELLTSLRWADNLFERHITSKSAQLRRKIDVALRRGGKLQNYILLRGTRWEEAEINRTQPKLQYFLWADLEDIEHTFEHDEDVKRELRREPKVYCKDAKRAYKLQQEWWQKVRDFPSVKLIKRSSSSKERFAQDIIKSELLRDLDSHGLKTTYKSGVFISYSSLDQAFADRLFTSLQEHEIPCWFAPKDLKGGAKLEDQIDQAIQNHEWLLVVLSENSIQSDWVIREVRKALKHGKHQGRPKLFPIRLTNMRTISTWESFYVDLVKDLGEEIREFHIPDFSNWRDQNAFGVAMERLVGDLRQTQHTLP